MKPSPAAVAVPIHQPIDVTHGRSTDMIERKSPEFRELVERAYANHPAKTHSELVYMGYWTIATQLKIDYQAGRLA